MSYHQIARAFTDSLFLCHLIVGNHSIALFFGKKIAPSATALINNLVITFDFIESSVLVPEKTYTSVNCQLL